MYMSDIEGQNVGGRLPVKRRDRVNKYYRERSDRYDFDHAMRQSRERCRILLCLHP